MSLYFKNYTLKQKLKEYAELSANKYALEQNLLANHITKDMQEKFNKLKSGEINNVLKINKIIDEIVLKKNN